MKTILPVVALLVAAIPTQAQSPLGLPETQYVIGERDANHRVWLKVDWQTNQLGELVWNTNVAYVELATGLHYRDARGEWQETKEEFSVIPGWATAWQGPHKVSLAHNLNTTGALELILPDGQFLRSQVLSLHYIDSTGQTVLLGTVQDSEGAILPPNQVVYRDAFKDLKADVRYTYTKAGVEQDIILRQKPPSPSEFGLNPESTRLVVLTEFIDAPSPIVTDRSGEADGADGRQVALPDEQIVFGSMRLGRSRSFALNEDIPDEISLQEAHVSKKWLRVDERDFLLEEVLWMEARDGFEKLPEQSSLRRSPTKSRYTGYAGLEIPELPRPKALGEQLMARAGWEPEPGYVLDYVVLNSNQTNFTFKADTTYHITGFFNIDGTTVFEGGTVIKYAFGGQILVNGPYVCDTAPYRPAIFTSMNDNSVGEVISGSSGYPGWTDSTWNLYIASTGGQLKNLRFSYTMRGASQQGLDVWNCQFVNCHGFGLAEMGNAATLRNVLFANCGFFGIIQLSYNGMSLVGEHLTADQCGALANTQATVALTNSLLTAVGYLPASVSNSPTVAIFGSGSGIYETVGGGAYYLATNCPSGIRDAGTPNITTSLLADLKTKTTHPPIVYSNTTISAATVFHPQALRDSNGALDLGYHYAPLDYVLGEVTLSANLTLTNGVAIGLIGNYGLNLQPGAQMLSMGTPQQMNRVVACELVQEQPVTSGAVTLYNTFGAARVAFDARFTEFSLAPGNFSLHTIILSGTTTPPFSSFSLQDCSLYGANIWIRFSDATGVPASISMVNNLLFRSAIEVDYLEWNQLNTPLNLIVRNNLFKGGSLALYYNGFTSCYGNWSVTDNLFDGASQTLSDASGCVVVHHNGFTSGTANSLGGSNNQTGLTAGLQSGALGDYYYSAGFTNLFNAGSTNAGLLGLYHYTTTTNQVKETNSVVDIGYHYVAVDSNGNALDADGDGVPDYLEDANGNGTHDPGEAPWGLAILAQPQSQTVSVGGNATFTVIADGLPSLSYQWKRNGTNLVAATSSSLVMTNVSPAQAGSYTVVVSNVAGSITSSVAVLIVTCLPAPSNLVGWWPAEGNAQDVFGGHDGSLQGGVSYTNGMVGLAFRFSGNNQRIDIPDASELRPSNFTVETWVHPTSLSSGWRTILLKASTSGLSYGLYARDGTDNWPAVYLNVGGDDIAARGSAALPLNTWTHLAATYNGTTLRLYTNGVLAGSRSVTGNIAYSAHPLSLGGNTSWSDEYFAGRIDEASLYNRALSANEIAAIYQANSSGKCLPPLTILIHPGSRFALVGDSVTMSVVASGAPPLTYQWYFNGTNLLVGATNASLTLPNVQITNSGAYSVVVANAGESVLSTPALLDVRQCFSALDVALVIDRSTSMNEAAGSGLTRIQAARIASSNFVQQLNFTNDQAALFSFSSNVTTNQTLTNNLPLLLQRIGQVAISTSGTVMTNALLAAQAELAGSRHNPDALPLLVFLTDGEPDDTTNEVLAVAAQLKNAGARLITVGLGTGLLPASLTFLRAMATTTNNFYHATNVTQLTNVFSLIADSICRGESNPNPNVEIAAPTEGQLLFVNSNAVITANATTPSGTVSWVQFFAGTKSLGITTQGTNNLYSIPWKPVIPGTNVLAALVMDSRGSNAYSAPVHVLVHGLPQVSISNPTNNAKVGPALYNLAIDANATVGGATITNVSFYSGTNLIGVDTTSPFSVTWPSRPAGTYVIHAKAIDTLGAVGYSHPVTVTVRLTNQPPAVDAGPNQTNRMPNAVLLLGNVTDDGLLDGVPLGIQWSKVSGPGTVTFASPSSPATATSFSTNGTYVLRLTADDSQYAVSSNVIVTVLSANQAPMVEAGTNRTVLLAAKYDVTNSLAIASAQSSRSSRGKEFWLGFPSNLGFDSFEQPVTFTLFITSEKNSDVTISVPGIGFFTNITAVSGEMAIVELPSSFENSVEVNAVNSIENKGIHVRSSNEISIYGLSRRLYIADAFTALPVNVLGRHYILQSWMATERSSELLVVGTEKNTRVIISPSFDDLYGSFAAWESITNILNQGQCIQLKTQLGGDPTGTLVGADKPIAVFGAAECIRVPDENTAACDALIEQIPPIASWGREFFTVPLASRHYDYFRVTASADATEIRTNDVIAASLDGGETFTFTFHKAGKISSDKPVIVAQYATGSWSDAVPYDVPLELAGDPFMMLIPPYEQFLTDYVFSTATNNINTNYINIVVTNAGLESVYLDGTQIAASNFITISNALGQSCGYSCATIGVEPTSHRLTSVYPLGIYVYGYGYYESYGYFGGLNLGSISSVASICISPNLSTNEVGATSIFAVEVFDTLTQTIPGVRVDFQVSGSNSLNGVAYTDESGVARFYYIGTNSGVDIVRATLGTNSVTATNILGQPFFQLNGFVSDDGLPNGILNILWSQTNGPSAASFSSASITNPVVTVSEEGRFVFRLTANDTELASYDEVAIEVRRNQAPVVDAGPDLYTKGVSFTLQGGVSDDGLPGGSLSMAWTKVSGPGTVIFANVSNAITTATFDAPGPYVLRLTGNDSQAVVYDDVKVTILVDAKPVQCGDTITTNLTTSDLRSMERGGSYANYYSFSGASNQILVVTMTSTNFDSYLFIRNQQLQILAEADDAMGSTNSQIIYVLPADGDYLIEATSYETNATGTYTIQFECGLAPQVRLTAPANGSVYTVAPTNILLTAEASDADGLNQVDLYANEWYLTSFYPGSVPNWTDSFSWTDVPTGIYALTAVAYDNSSMSSTSAPVTIIVGKPTLVAGPTASCPGVVGGTHTVTATLKGGSGQPLSGTSVTFMVSGANTTNRTVVTDGSGIASFTYTSTNYGRDTIVATNVVVGGEQIVADPVEKNWARPLSCNQIMIGSLTTGDGDSSRHGYADYYSFVGQSGATISLTLKSTVFDTFLILRDANCNVVTNNDDFGGTTDSQILTTLPSNGYYTVEVTSALPRKTGTYNLAFNCEASTNTSPEIGILVDGQSVANHGTLDFGVLAVGSSNTITLVITNSGTGDLNLTSLSLSSNFILASMPTNPVVPGGTTSMALRFVATTNGVQTGTFSLANNDADNGDGVENPFVLNLRATANISGTPPSISLTAPASGAAYPYGQPITVSATATAGSSPVAKVEFFAMSSAGRLLIGRDTSSPYTMTWMGAAAGDYTLTAEATDTAGRISNSVPVSVHVEVADNNHVPVARPDEKTVLVNSIDNYIDVLVNDTDADGDPLRIISVGGFAKVPGSATIIENGKALSFTPLSDTAGGGYFPYVISDGRGGIATNVVSITIPIPQPPTVTLINPTNSQQFMAGALVTVSANPTVTLGAVATVTFYLDGQPIKILTNAPYSFNWTAKVGTHEFLAVVRDSIGQEDQTELVMVDVSYNPSDQAPVAAITFPTTVTNVAGVLTNTHPPVITEGLLEMRGQATDADGTPSYRINLYDAAGVLVANLTTGNLDEDGFRTGSVAWGGVLGTNDLTRFANGSYELELVVRQAYRETRAYQVIELQSELKVGQFSFSQQDLVIPAGGIPLTVVRTYNSMNPQRGDFGYGWTWALNDMEVTLEDYREEVEELDGFDYFSLRAGGSRDVTLTLPDGRRTTFYFRPQQSGTLGNYYAAWTNYSPALVGYTLTAQGPTLLQALLSMFGVEPLWQDYATGSGIPMENFDFKGFILTTPDGTIYQIDREDLGEHSVYWDDYGFDVHTYGKPYLSKVVLRSQESIEINGDTIVFKDASQNPTRQVSFQRNSRGLVAAVTDPNSEGSPYPAYKYEYDHRDNLLNVLQLVNRATGAYLTNSFSYTNKNFPHYITGIIDPRGITVARNEYDDDGRLTAVVDADGKRTEFIHNTEGRVEIVVDRLGHTNSYAYDLRGNVVAATNALGVVTRMGYDPGTNYKIAETNAFGTAQATWTLYAFNHKGYQTNVVTSPNHSNSFAYDDYGNVLWQRDPVGNVTTNGYDGFGNLTSTVQLDALGQVVSQSSSSYENGRLMETRDANNQVTASFGYDPSGNLTSTTDANGLTRNFTYDANGNQTGSSYTWTPPGGGSPVTVSNLTVYDAQGRVTMSVDALGNTNRTFYNPLGKVDYSMDKFGNTSSFLYDPRGNLIQTTHADGLVTRTVYDDAGRAFLTTDRNGVTARLTHFDAAGRATNVVRLLNTVVNLEAGPRTVISSMGTPISTNATEYFPSGWVKSRTGPDGQKTTYAYWPDGQTMYVTNALNQTMFYHYDAAGRQEYVADALNRTNRFVYDAVGRNIKTVFHDGTFITNIFNNLGQRVGVKDQANLLTQFAYDLSGQLTNVTKPSVFNPETGSSGTPSWSYKYDDYGRLTVTTDPKGCSTTNTFDAFGREVTRGLPMGQTNWTKYNSLGQVSEVWGFKKQKKKFVYDRFGRVATNYLFETGATYPSNSVAYLYNQLGQLATIIERSGTDASTGYVASIGSPNGRARHTVRAALAASIGRVPQGVQGGLLGLILCGAAFACVSREKRQRLVCCMVETWRAQLHSLSAIGGEGRDVVRSPKRLRLPSYGWRFASLITIAALLGSDPQLSALWIANAQCSIPPNYSTATTRITNFTYDVEGRLAQVNSPEGVINYSYDLATGRHIRTCTQNSEIAYEYDQLGRLWKVNVLKRNGIPVNETTTYTYTAVGSRATVTLPNGVKTGYAYDAINRLTGLTNRASDNSILSQFNYQLDSTGRRTNAVEILKTEDGPYQTNTLSWKYDGLNRLTNEVCISTVTGASYTNAFQYDLAGNRWQQIRYAGGNTTTITNQYNANDQLLKEVTRVGSTLTATNLYAYDANGSLFAKTNISSSSATVLYGYDLKNKLSSVTTVGSGVTNYFHYNDSGIRVQTWATGGSPTLYLVDANNHTGYAQVLEELTSLGGAAAKSYVIGDDVLAQAYGSGAASYLLYDGHGSTRQLVDSTGGVTSRYNYDAYGVTLNTSTSTPETSLLYCGEQFDENLEMYNLRARFYDPSNGRLNAMDSFRGSNENPQSLHKYAYAHCEPVNGIDPGGNMTLPDLGMAMLIGAGLGALIGAVYGGIKAGVKGAVVYGALGLVTGALGAAAIIGAGMGIAAAAGVSEGLGIFYAGSLAGAYGIGSSGAELILAETPRDRYAALFALSVAMLLQGAATKWYVNAKAGRGTYTDRSNGQASELEVEMARLAADHFKADIVSSPRVENAGANPDFTIALQGKKLEFKDVRETGKFQRLMETISHAQADNVMILVKEGQLSQSEINSISGRLFSLKSGSSKNSVTIVEQVDGGYGNIKYLPRDGTKLIE